MSRRRPNILWICTDQQRYDTIHALGNEAIRTPNLDRLLSEGVAFTRAYTQSPICTPSRACFLSGQYPTTIHVNRNGNLTFPDDVPLVTKMLADSGYDCGLAGKLHLAGAELRVEPRVDDGYRVFQWSHHPQPEAFWPGRSNAYQAWLQDQGVNWDDIYDVGDQDRHSSIQDYYPPGVPAEYHQTNWCANEAIGFLSENRDRPWLMSVNPFDPHAPLDPPREYLERMDVDKMPLPLFREEELAAQAAFSGVDHQTKVPTSPEDYSAKLMVAAYYAQIELIDDQVGRMLQALEDTGQRENTMVIFMSDHGEMLGDHGLRLKGCRFYEGAVHVPLIISWPGHIEAGLRSDALVELADMAPTVLDAAGLEPNPEMQGRSLWPILTGQADPSRHHSFVRCEFHDAINEPLASHANMLFDGRYKLVVYHGVEMGELYDLENDPHEFVNLWADPAWADKRFELMKTLFDALMLATDPGQPRFGAY